MNQAYTAIPAAILSALLCTGCASTPVPETAPSRSTDAIADTAPAQHGEDVIIAALPAPQAAMTETAAYTPPAEAEVVCTLERRTGSNRKFKVCRRPQTALDEAETRRTFDSLRRTQMGEHR